LKNRVSLVVAVSTSLMFLAGCGVQYTYEADPIGGEEKCFNIERESDYGDEETNLGTYCRQGESSDD
jgi:hypothetical protein